MRCRVWCGLVAGVALTIAVSVSASSARASAPETSPSAPDVAVAVQLPQPLRAAIDYRVALGVAVDRVAVSAGDRALRVLASSPYPYDGATTAVFMLVDTSKSRRPGTLEQNARDIGRIV